MPSRFVRRVCIAIHVYRSIFLRHNVAFHSHNPFDDKRLMRTLKVKDDDVSPFRSVRPECSAIDDKALAFTQRGAK